MANNGQWPMDAHAWERETVEKKNGVHNGSQVK